MQIKQDMAKMLGYNNFAELSLSKKMAKDVNSVMKLTDMLRARSFPVAQAELENLKEFAKKEGYSGNLELWDIPYFSERLREKKYEFSEEELRPYFSLPAVLDGLFTLAERLFGITIKKADGKAEVWNPDVGFFNIYDSVSFRTIFIIPRFYLRAYLFSLYQKDDE